MAGRRTGCARALCGRAHEVSALRQCDVIGHRRRPAQLRNPTASAYLCARVLTGARREEMAAMLAALPRGKGADGSLRPFLQRIEDPMSMVCIL